MIATPRLEQPQPNHRHLDQKIIRMEWDGHEKEITVEDKPKTEMPIFDNIFSPTAENYIIKYIDSL